MKFGHFRRDFGQVDLFAFSAKDLQQWERYWPHLEAYLHCGTPRLPAGQCWPYDS